jgi:hypothetical protein
MRFGKSDAEIQNPDFGFSEVLYNETFLSRSHAPRTNVSGMKKIGTAQSTNSKWSGKSISAKQLSQDSIPMTTSQEQSFLTDILEGKPIPIGKLEYFRARLRSKFHQLVLDEFLRQEDMGKISQADLARRIGRKPEQISRWLGAAGNWTLDTMSDLLLGMGTEPDLFVAPVIHEIPNNLIDPSHPKIPPLGTVASFVAKEAISSSAHSGWEDALKGSRAKPPLALGVAARL